MLCSALGLYEAARLMIVPDWPLAIRNARRVEAVERALHVAREGELQSVFLGLPELVRDEPVIVLATFDCGHLPEAGRDARGMPDTATEQA